jgi:hypothetical protein
MKLTPVQLKEFDELGYLVMPSCFSEEEIAVLRSEAEAIYASDRKEVWRETSGAPRTAFAAHTYNEAFGLLGRHPRLIEPLEQLFGEFTCTSSRSTPAPHYGGVAGTRTTHMTRRPGGAANISVFSTGCPSTAP